MPDRLIQICADLVRQEACFYWRRDAHRGKRNKTIAFADITNTNQRRTRLQALVTRAVAKAAEPDWVALRVVLNPLATGTIPRITVEGWFEEPDGSHGPTRIKEYRTEPWTAVESASIGNPDSVLIVAESLDFTPTEDAELETTYTDLTTV